MGLNVDITKNFFNGSGKKDSRPDFSLHCVFDAANEIIVLFGCSGSGKTTALQCIAGLEKPDAGNVLINDRIFFDSTNRINMPPQKRRVGYVFQNITLFPHMNVKQNIAFALKRPDKNEKETRIREVMELVRIRELESYYPSQLSGGQKQRVVLARTLAAEPDLLLLDEPFSALDTIVRMRLREEIKAIQRTLDIPVLFVTHNPVEAFTMADKIAVFHEGSVQQFGTPEDVFYHPATRYVAELVGFTNLFDGALVECYNICSMSARIKFKGISLDVPYMDRRPDKTVTWGIRPENIRICKTDNPQGNNGNIFPGVIRNIVNKGAGRLVFLKINDDMPALVAEVTNHTLSAMELDEGDECLVELKMSDIAVF